MSRFRSSAAPGGGRPGARAGKGIRPDGGDTPGDEQAGPGGERAAAPDAVLRAELARLLAAERAPEARDALDVLWIARLSGLDPVDWSHLGPSIDTSAPSPPADPLPPSPPDDRPAPHPRPEEPTAQLHLPGGTGGTAPARPGGAHAIRVAQPPALSDPLSLTRALRPLRRWVPSAHARVLDVEATAAASGETGLLLPVLRPAIERRFSVDLLIDTGATMTVWHRLAGELRTLLARHGAFADVRAWALHTDGPEPTLAPFRSGTRAASPTRRWREALADPAGRRAVLVLTDAVGPAWYGTELPATLADWSRRRPVAALQVLPSRLWHRTALGTSPVRARGTEAASATIEVRSSGPLPGIARGRAGAADRERIRWLPVMEADDAWLAPWARLVSGRTTDWVPLHAAPLTVVERPRPLTASEEPATPAAWVEHFEEGYSPEAFRLLRLLAAAPLSLPVMRLVQRAMLPSSTPMHLAEIFLSGLLVRRTPPGPGEDPDRVLYDFRPGVRDALLGRLTRTESLRVLRRVLDGVSERVAATLGGVTDFGALVAAVGAEGDGALDGLELPEESRAFAEVAVAVIGGVGGDYKEVAARLGVRGSGTGARGAPADPEPEPEPDPEVVEGRRSRWLPWRRDRRRQVTADGDSIGVSAAGSVHVAGCPTNLPDLPALRTHIRSDEVGLVVGWLLAISRRAVGRGYPLQRPTTWVIEGGQGVGKTTLAVDCAHRVIDDFTLVRWIRAHSFDVLLEDLNALADDLGIPPADPEAGPLRRLAELRAHLRSHPGWLLIYDGVTPQTIRSGGPAYKETWALSQPPQGYGALLVTLSEGARWPDPMSGSLKLADLNRDKAISYLAKSLESQHGELWHNLAELGDIVDVEGGNPRRLLQIGAMLTAARRPVGHYVHEVLARRVGDKFLRSLVWISRDGEFLVTGIAVRPDVVLAARRDPLVGGHVRVHRQDGADFAAVTGRVGSAGPSLMRLDLVEGALPAVPPARPDSSPVVAAWYELHARTGAPVLTLRPASSKPHPPPGAVLIDADGRLCSVVGWSAEGPVRVDAHPMFIDHDESQITARDRDNRRLLVWPEPKAVMREALIRHRYQPVVVHSREEVEAQLAAHPAALFVDPMTGSITRTALQSLRQAAVAAGVPMLVTAGLGQTSREAAYDADPAVWLKALAPRDGEQHRQRVLLIEERAGIAQALATALELRGIRVMRATAANAMILASELRPNLVLMGLMQVHQERYRIVHWLREYGLLDRTPIVAYTTAVEQTDLARLASGETVLYVAERANSREVRDRIVELLARIGFD
ncbi:SAV_2336 N-terminal domain-related protein [Streptomyces sp. NPDC014864]|uniref:SAV_2336 N-terminal domain-related protein n=1 Tax=Streptomyces sp. NPDC014864 TaxID=3364924 RepID=UPI0036FA8E74